MQKLENKLTVYLSKSMLLTELELKPVRDKLIGLGFNVTEYDPIIPYNDNLVRNADFVLFVTKEKLTIKQLSSTILVKHLFSVFVGKGQYSEAELCVKLNKPAFLFDYIYNSKLLVSKLNDEFISPTIKNELYDTNDWKIKYGILKFYIQGNNTIDLYHFIEGHFKLHQYPLTLNECYQFNYQLLLLK